jgi:hypothetical protein
MLTLPFFDLGACTFFLIYIPLGFFYHHVALRDIPFALVSFDPPNFFAATYDLIMVCSSTGDGIFFVQPFAVPS